MNISVVVFLAIISQLQKVEKQTCPNSSIRAAKELIVANEKIGHHWSTQGLIGLARRTCIKTSKE